MCVCVCVKIRNSVFFLCQVEGGVTTEDEEAGFRSMVKV